VSPGNIVGPDSGVLATVVSESPMRVLFPITQRELLQGAPRRRPPPPRRRCWCACGWPTAALYKDKGKIDFIDVTVDPKTDGQLVAGRCSPTPTGR